MFTDTTKKRRPLRTLLERWSSTAWQNADVFPRRTFLQLDNEAIVRDLMQDWVRAAKRLARPDVPNICNRPRRTNRRNDTSISPQYWRWTARYSLIGNLELLDFWPEQLDREPCESDLDFEPAPRFVWLRAQDSSPIAYIDIPRETDPRGLTTPSEQIFEATEFIDAAISASNAEMIDFEQDLLRSLREKVSIAREEYDVIAQNNAATIELIRLRLPTLKFEPLPEVAVQVEQPDSPEGKSTASTDIELVRLVHTSFKAVVDVCEQWGISAQSYATVYNRLDEDAITSLLVTTLNVAFESARRETFELSGKTDLYVEVFDEGGLKKAYIGEAKIWRGQSRVEKDLRQLLGNAPTHIREVLLLFYVRARGIEAVKRDANRAIAKCNGLFGRWQEVGLSAIIRHPNSDYDVLVKFLFFHFPPPTPKTKRSSGKARRRCPS